MQRAVAATAVMRLEVYSAGAKAVFKLIINNRPVTVTPGAHRCNVGTEAESPLDHGVVMRFGVSTQHANMPRKDVNSISNVQAYIKSQIHARRSI
eukprot:5276000-Pleurochrysis_carterae.AAC.3